MLEKKVEKLKAETNCCDSYNNTWSKDFFPGDLHVVGDSWEDCWPDEVTLGMGSNTSSFQFRSLALSALDLQQTSLELTVGIMHLLCILTKYLVRTHPEAGQNDFFCCFQMFFTFFQTWKKEKLLKKVRLLLKAGQHLTPCLILVQLLLTKFL